MYKKLTEKKPGFIVLNNRLVECLYWRELRYERSGPNDNDWFEYDMFCLTGNGRNISTPLKGKGYETREEAITAHNEYINEQIDLLKNKLL